MDHEYSFSGKLLTDDLDAVFSGNPSREYAVGKYVFVLTLTGKEANISLKDRRCAATISRDEVSEVCRELSRMFRAQVRMEKLHEEYGVANVFNGGSDYEVVSADRLVCVYCNGEKVEESVGSL